MQDSPRIACARQLSSASVMVRSISNSFWPPPPPHSSPPGKARSMRRAQTNGLPRERGLLRPNRGRVFCDLNKRRGRWMVLKSKSLPGVDEFYVRHERSKEPRNWTAGRKKGAGGGRVRGLQISREITMDIEGGWRERRSLSSFAQSFASRYGSGNI